MGGRPTPYSAQYHSFHPLMVHLPCSYFSLLFGWVLFENAALKQNRFWQVNVKLYDAKNFKLQLIVNSHCQNRKQLPSGKWYYLSMTYFPLAVNFVRQPYSFLPLFQHSFRLPQISVSGTWNNYKNLEWCLILELERANKRLVWGREKGGKEGRKKGK